MNAQDPAGNWSDGAVTPSDETTYVAPRPRAFCVLTTGDVSIESQDGSVLTWTGVPAGPSPYPYRAHKVLPATTAGVALLY